MKKFTVVIALLLALVMVLSACAGKTDPPANSANSANAANSSNSSSSTPAGNSGSQGTTPAKPDEGTKPANTQPANSNANTQPANPNGNTQPNGNPEPSKPAFNQNDLMDKIPFSVNDHVGWEFRDVTVNGEFRRISVQYEMDKADLELDELGELAELAELAGGSVLPAQADKTITSTRSKAMTTVNFFIVNLIESRCDCGMLSHIVYHFYSAAKSCF